MKPVRTYPGRLTKSPILLGWVILVALGLIVSHGAAIGLFSGLGIMLQLIFGGILMLVAIHKKWVIIEEEKPSEQEETPMKTKGFTLIELLIVIAIAAILIAVLWGAIGPRKAGAQTLGTHSQMGVFLTTNNIPFIWNQNAGRLIILNNPNASRWATAVAACAELKAHENRLTTVVLSDASGTELAWSAEQTITNLDGRDVANCL